ncbi:MAG: hypothetical protein K2G01_05880 [Paramuribaculum sp.]|nr:hypothetical protein [Paramuribaculum sp.]
MTKDTSRKAPFMPRQAWLVAVNIGLLLIVAGTALPLFHILGDPVRIIYSAGALTVLVGRLFAPSVKGVSLRIRRLCRLEVWVGIIFCAGAFFMWYMPQRMDWMAFTLAGAVVQVYVSMAVPKALASEKEAGKTSDIRKK